MFIKFIASPLLYFFNYCIKILSTLNVRLKKNNANYQMNYLDKLTTKVEHIANNNKNIELHFHTPNSFCMYRAESFSYKEPETLEWIEEFGKNEAVLFDIGANIGLYSIYHNKLNGGKCFAFEPSFFNIKLLLKNINLNDCQNLTSIVSNPLSNSVGFGEFLYGDSYYSSIEGGSGMAFGVDFGHDGKKINSQISSNVLGVSLDWMLENSVIEAPNLIKIDVDGIEHLILKGAKKILIDANCKSILVEVNDDFKDQANEVSILLISYGFSLRDKLQGSSMRNSNIYNQIWVKN